MVHWRIALFSHIKLCESLVTVLCLFLNNNFTLMWAFSTLQFYSCLLGSQEELAKRRGVPWVAWMQDQNLQAFCWALSHVQQDRDREFIPIMSVCGCATVGFFLCSSIPGGDSAGTETPQELARLEVINPGQCCLQETSQKLIMSPSALWGVTCSRSRTLREKGIIHCCSGLRQPVLRSHQLQALLQGIQSCADTALVCTKHVAEGVPVSAALW